MTTQANDKNPIPPLSNPITDRLPSLIWNAYFTNLKAFIDKLAAASLSPTPHNDLVDIQGGTDTERYHLTETQHNNVIQVPSFNGDSNQFVNGNGALSIPTHNNLSALQGGTSGEYYHLTLDQLNAITAAPTPDGVETHFYNGLGSFTTPDHAQLANLQGGAVGDRQHLTTPQVDKITNMESLVFGYLTLSL